MIDFIQTLLLGLLLGGVYALFAAGLTLVFGVMRIVNIAHAAFIFAAAFVSYQLNKVFGMDPLVSMVVNIPLGFLFGVVIYQVVLSRDAESPRYTEMTVLLTFALALMTEGILAFLFTGTVRSTLPDYATGAYFIDDLFIPKAQLYAGITSLILITLLWALLRFTRLGYAIRATMQNRAAAKTVGVNVHQVSMIAFGIGTALAGASGAQMSFLFSFFPSGHWEWIARLLALIVLGGMGHLMGSVVSAILLSVGAAFVSDAFGPTWSPLTFFLSLFIILLIRPQGLFGKKMEAA